MIAVECYPDEALALALGVPRARIRHASSKGNVSNMLRKQDCSTGMVDEDPASAQPRALARFKEVERRGAVKLLEVPGIPGQRLIVICPRLEDWFVSRAKANGLQIAKYGLAANAKALHKSRRYDKRAKFRAFLQDLVAEDAEAQALKRWLGS